LLLNAGDETTTNLIGNGLLALLRQPDRWETLPADPTLVGNAVEELLRFDSPTQMQFRWAADDLEIGDKAISRGQGIVIVSAAANRDPAEFSNPDRVDIRREPNHHAAFGFGPHYCMGAPLARLEGQVVFETLVRRLADPRLGDVPPLREPNPVLRGLKSLPVTFSRQG
jgi:pimeloyl-[acyl-carrier protein] synthase